MVDFDKLYDDKEVLVQNINSTMVTAPTISLVSTTVAKNYIKSQVNEELENALVDMFIAGATGKIEQELGGVALCEQMWRQTQTGGCRYIKLYKQPITSVDEVKYYANFDSTGEVLAVTDYRVVQPNSLIHKDGFFEKGREGDGYEITFKCGLYNTTNYTNVADPKLNALKTAILRTVAWMNEQRVEFQSGSGEGEWSMQFNQQILGRQLPIGIKSLLMPYHSGLGLI